MWSRCQTGWLCGSVLATSELWSPGGEVVGGVLWGRGDWWESGWLSGVGWCGYGLFAEQKIRSSTKITCNWGRQIHKQRTLVWSPSNMATHIIGPKEYLFKQDQHCWGLAWYALSFRH